MDPAQKAMALSVSLLTGMLLCLEVGYRVGIVRSGRGPELLHEGIGAIEAAIFAILGLLLGFSFAGAMSRLDNRRALIIREANAIGTAYLRLDVLPAGAQPDQRRLFREYLNTRLRAYEQLPDFDAADQEFSRAAEIQLEIWSGAIAALADDSPQNTARLLLLPTLNEMIDVTTDRTVALHTHLPLLIFVLLISIALLSGLVAGYAMAKRKRRSLLHMLLYAAAVAVIVYAIADLDSPRSGFIRLDAADNALLKLLDSIR